MDSFDVVDACDSGFTHTLPRLLIKLGILYCVVTFWCWNELRFQAAGIELPAEIEATTTYHRSNGNHNYVRYHYRNPETGNTMTHTTNIRGPKAPQTGSATIEFLGGSVPQSRLLVERRPWVVSFFVWFNVAIASVIVGTLGYVIWDYHRIPDGHLSPKERALARFHRRRRAKQAWKV